jgi:hypothetical protein
MRKFLTFFALAFCFILGCAGIFLATAGLLNINVLGLFVSSATKVVGVFGDRFPILHTKYGDLQIRSSSTAEGQSFQIGCAVCRLSNPLLSAEPFTTENAVISGTLNDNHFVGQAVVEQVKVQLDTIWKSYSFSGSFNLPQTKIADIYHALRSIVPEADKAHVNGTIQGKGKFSWPDIYLLFEPRLKNFEVSGLFDRQKYLSGKFQYQAEDAEGREITVESGEGTANWLPLSALGRSLPAAVIAIEDRGFYLHHGFDIQNIISATNHNKRLGKIKRGGSTLSQQLAKNLFLSDERTYARKLRELLYAVELDRELGKNRELELYLNIAEWGPNIFGAKAAAEIYFHKSPTQLLPEEAAWLASILRGPKSAYKKQYLRNHPNMLLVDHALSHMRTLSDDERDQAKARAIVFTHER